MRSNLTDITVVLDRSGSMEGCRTDAEGGLNHFIEKQKTEPGEAAFTLVQFDTEYEFVHKGVPIRDVPAFTLHPRGATALLDAIGKAINETGTRLGGMNEADRPGLVAFVIITDGHENSSKEFTRARIKEMIQHQTDNYQWQFTFLGANQDAFAEGGAMGLTAGGILNYTSASSGQAFAAASSNVARMRCAASKGQEVKNLYTDAERQAATAKV